MCGIVGVVSKTMGGFYQHQVDIFEELLIVDSLRGFDSTGSFCVNKNGSVNGIKHETHPLHMLTMPDWKGYRSDAINNGRILVGHNRAATKGDITNANAHPFFEGHIALVHNGTLNNHKDLANTDVDSNAIAIAIKDLGYLEALKKMKGAWSLVWYDQKEKALYLTTNGDRPLCLVETKDRFWFGSEMGMLYWVLGRNREEFDVKETYRMVEHDMVKITLNPFKLEKSNIKEEVKPKFFRVPSTVVPTNGTTMVALPATPIGTNKRTRASTAPFDIDPVCAIYPANSPIIIYPKSLTRRFDDGKTTKWKLEGWGYQPGQTIMKIVGHVDLETEEDAADLQAEDKLVAKMMYASREAGDAPLLYVREIATDTWTPTWLGNELPDTEWEYICNNYICVRCWKQLDYSEFKYTSVKPISNTDYNCVCHNCVIKARKGMKPEYANKLAGAVEHIYGDKV